jgi:hypothetical protein
MTESQRSPDPLPPQSPGDDEPDVRGTVFLMVFFLMLMVGMWVLMYFQLLSR